MKAMVLAGALAALALPMAALPAVAQAAGLTFEEVQRKYRKMSPVFIRKCDHNGDGVYANAELQCVAGIYNAMYVER